MTDAFVLVLAVALAAFCVLAWRTWSRWNARIWAAGYVRQRLATRRHRTGSATTDVVFAFVDHFEPGWHRPSYAVECARVQQWREGYPRLVDGIVDAGGHAPRHSFFYPEEEYRPEHLEQLVDLCRRGYGEIELHLHHDDDTADGLRGKLRGFVDVLHRRHGALSIDPATGRPAWAFIHGNWALANSRADGRWCGVNDELRVLREEGCYADFTFPSAPDGTQPATVNSIYYASSDPGRPRAHERGVEVEVGGAASGDLMIVQGPLGLNWGSRRFGVLPTLENADVRMGQPPTRRRVDDWVRCGISVRGRPEWVFVKVHTHGTQERDMPLLLGEATRDMYAYLATRYNDGSLYRAHFASAREMYNIIKAAEAGRSGNAGDFRDFLLPPPSHLAVTQGLAS